MAGLYTMLRKQLVGIKNANILQYENIVPMTKCLNIDDSTWQNAISNQQSLIVVKRNEPNLCPGVKVLYATNNICHIIGMMYKTLLRDYNENLPDQ
ncbi:hypothetical protein GLOIN_2v1734606 [Rhizophagus clarus]|uniref:Uncharacterized protein n=1 Tax=Rhizophagus clarus TaxID=94130 RepID=A0A8H3M6F1_9GLOM|nr:hypothetical protein GLOIN_2v1734606 [Rhizophagus clarus]